MKTILCIVGPTASGKTALAEAVARKIPSRLISVDAMQVYRGMDIGTAKPPLPGRRAWSMLDLVDPGQGFSAAQYAAGAREAVEQAWQEGKLAILAGGSGLYFRALLEGLAEIPSVDAAVRAGLAGKLQQEGLEPLAAELRRRDPETAAQTDMRNPRRVLRALEVLHGTGRPLSAWQKEKPGKVLQADQVFWAGLGLPRPELAGRIQARVEAMLAAGWPREAADLERRHGAAAVLATGAIGYAEMLELAHGRLDAARAVERIAAATRQYARRQDTWFRRNSSIRWIPPGVESVDLWVAKALPWPNIGRIPATLPSSPWPD